ncbi:MAG: hypothetical protein K8R52_05905 [Bacteroidales bacterium]|nr:hypothetical protein [Bacteroidales bacterium]
MKKKNTIPLIVDDVKTHESFEMTRLIYFSIGAVDFLSDLLIEYDNQEFPVTVVDFHGIITGTLDNAEFETKESIETLFDRIEDTDGLFVDTNDIWLPNEMFAQPGKRSDLIRVSTHLFKLALTYRSDKLSYSDFIASTSDLVSDIYESPVEDNAFKEWFKAQIEFAIDTYNKSPEKIRLKYLES